MLKLRRQPHRPPLPSLYLSNARSMIPDASVQLAGRTLLRGDRTKNSEGADMKLGLLIVVAVAVLLPSFSESWIVPKCELRDKLREKLKLPRRLEEGILATVICEVDRRSRLNTAVVTVIGNRIPTTPKPTMITAPATTGAKNMTIAATIQPTNANSTTTQLTNTIATATTTTITTTTATSPAAINATISSVNPTLMSNSTDGGRRRKREADSSSEEDDSQMKDGHILKPLSLGLYGLFQLSDKQFCDSGYRQSRNVCRTSCTAFTDDDITDDIACVVKTGYWRQILDSASRSCHRTSDFFRECK